MTTKDFQTRGLLRIFLSYFKPHRRLFALDMTCAFLIAVVDLAFPLVSRTALYTWLPEKQFRVFFIVMAAVVAAYVVRSGLYFVVAYWGHTFGIRVEADIRRDLYHHMQELGFDFYDKNRTGQLMSRLTSDLFEVTELAHHGPEDLFISLVTIVGALVVMFCIRWELALVLLVMLPVLLLAAVGMLLCAGGDFFLQYIRLDAAKFTKGILLFGLGQMCNITALSLLAPFHWCAAALWLPSMWCCAWHCSPFPMGRCRSVWQRRCACCRCLAPSTSWVWCWAAFWPTCWAPPSWMSSLAPLPPCWPAL